MFVDLMIDVSFVSFHFYPIIDENFHYVVDEVTNDEKKQIEEWTGLSLSETLFDSAEDNWKISIDLNDMIIKKKQLLFMIL